MNALVCAVRSCSRPQGEPHVDVCPYAGQDNLTRRTTCHFCRDQATGRHSIAGRQTCSDCFANTPGAHRANPSAALAATKETP